MEEYQTTIPDFLQPRDAWDKLSMYEKAAKMKVAVQNGIYNLKDIRDKYNEFAEGGDVLTNEYSSGGGIHIKPSHRGRLAELKKRTGKTEAEFYNDGNPAHKRMVVFARNSRKWKHGEGSNLYEGTSLPTQKMQIGLIVTNGWPDYTLGDILANAQRIQERKQTMHDALERSVNDYLTTSNDATTVANGRPQNQHLTERAVEGAKAHAAWEEEHPNLTAWGNTLAAVPFAEDYAFMDYVFKPTYTSQTEPLSNLAAYKARGMMTAPMWLRRLAGTNDYKWRGIEHLDGNVLYHPYDPVESVFRRENNIEILRKIPQVIRDSWKNK